MQQESDSSLTDISWDRLEEWIGNRPGLIQRWDSVRQLKASAEKALLPYELRYKRLERQWKRKLKPLCGNSNCWNWEGFRPLRPSREEDWSDWLAWLLETSVTGLLGEILFGSFMDAPASLFRSPEKKVRREVLTENRERRADIVAEWNKYSITHIELKIGDQNFEKTFETGRLLRALRSKEAKWMNAIVIPETSRATWKSVAEKFPTEFIREILWDDVAHGLRKCLWVAREPVFWRVWAWSFCCTIEARILQLRRPDQSKPGLNHLTTAARWVEILAMEPREARISMKPDMKAFLKDGVRLYADAVEAVKTFKTEMAKLFKTAVDSRASWQPLKSHNIEELEWSGNDVDQHWFYIMITGEAQNGQKAQIECGLWWNAPRPSGPIVYAVLFSGDKRVEFEWVDGTDGIHSFEFCEGTHIYLPIPDSIEIKEPVNRLLDAILEHLGTMPKQLEA